MLSIACYSFKGARRVRALLESAKIAGWTAEEFVIAQDPDPGTGRPIDAEYQQIADGYGARHEPLPKHGHMGGCNHWAVEKTCGDWILVCSDDVLLPRGLISALHEFLSDNPEGIEQLRIAAVYLHHLDRHEIGPAIASVSDDPEWQAPRWNRVRMDSFFYGQDPASESWWWRRLKGRIGPIHWSEPTPSSLVAFCSNVHGSAYLVSRRYWNLAGGTIGVDTWQQDTLLSARINQFTDGVIARLPFLPSLAHYGGAAEAPIDPDGRWLKSAENLAMAQGCLDVGHPPWAPEGCRPPGTNYLNEMEHGWKLRALARWRKDEDRIWALDYSYRDLVA